jgi:hypothetical protein
MLTLLGTLVLLFVALYVGFLLIGFACLGLAHCAVALDAFVDRLHLEYALPVVLALSPVVLLLAWIFG